MASSSDDSNSSWEDEEVTEFPDCAELTQPVPSNRASVGDSAADLQTLAHDVIRGDFGHVRRLATRQLVTSADAALRTVLMLVADDSETPVQSEKCILYLFELGANPKAADANGDTAAHLAARRDHLRLLTLLSFDAKWLRNDNGATPLMEAARTGSWKCAKHLLHLLRQPRFNESEEHGNSKRSRLLEMEDLEGRTALDLARLSGHSELAGYIEREMRLVVVANGRISGLTDQEEADRQELERLVKAGDSTGLLRTATRGNSDLPNSWGQTALMWAAMKSSCGDEALWEQLVQLGDPTCADMWAESCLQHAVRAGNCVAASALLAAGASANARERAELTPLMWAAFLAPSDTAAAVGRVLMDSGSNWSLKDCYGMTALDLATQKGKSELAELLRGTELDHERRVVAEAARAPRSGRRRRRGREAGAEGSRAPMAAGRRTGAERSPSGRRAGAEGGRGSRRAPKARVALVGPTRGPKGETPGATGGRADWADSCCWAAVLLCCGAAVLLCCSAAVLRCCCAAVLLCCCCSRPRRLAARTAQGRPGPPFLESWEAVRLISRGGFGEVHEVRTDTGVTCAAKTLRLPVQLGDELPSVSTEILRAIESERNLCLLRHPNIVRFLHIAQPEPATVVVFMELLDGRSLERFIDNKPLDELTIRHFSEQICRALLYLHSRQPPVIHRDINCSNIIVCADNTRIKLIDFGLSIKLEQSVSHILASTQSPKGTPNFMAPELLEAGESDSVQCSRESDIWAFGCSVFQMASGERPFANARNFLEMAQLIGRSGAPPSRTAELRDFYSRCTAKERKERNSAQQLLEHEFLTAGKCKEEDFASRFLVTENE
uniref:Protein kinase domain-containing protein n=1 Tax=Macrostomum lignano TaxID=282301 RepID=A0A1I8H569_9PLAT